MSVYILAINPGSTTTKIGLFDGDSQVFTTSIDHKIEELDKYDRMIDQIDLRLGYILDFLSEKNFQLTDLKAVVGRGGLLKPISGGTYKVNDLMIEDLRAARRGEHASNLGALLARAVGDKAQCPAYIVDPVVVDELEPVARFSGSPELERSSIFHALNQKAVARKYARDNGRKYQEITLIVTHLGGGISVGLHHQGKIIDVNNALSGDGPFSPNRSGGLPAFNLFELCFSGKYSYDEIKKMLIGNGGVAAYLGTNDMREVERRIADGDKEAELVFEAMVYQVSKEIGSLVPVVEGRVDAIILTGGVAYSELFTDLVKKRVGFIAPVEIYPGEEELEALAAGGYRVLTGEEEPKTYK